MIKYCKFSMLILCVLAVTGCSHMSSQQMSELRTLAESAQKQASQASLQAQNALSVAGEANFAAEQAKNSVGTALACCQDNRARLEAAMREAMRKGR